MDIINEYILEEGVIGIGLLTFTGVILTLYIAVYILYIFGIFRMAKRRNIKNSWIAFIPIINSYILGQIVNPLKIGNKTITNTPVLLLIIHLTYFILRIALPLLTTLFPYISFFSICCTHMLIILVWLLFLLIYYKIYQIYTKKPLTFTLLSIIPMLAPIFIFLFRNNKPNIDSNEKEQKKYIEIIFILIYLLFVIFIFSVGIFKFLSNLEINNQYKSQPLEFISYENKDWEIKFNYPKNYTKTDETIDKKNHNYSVTFMNDLECKDPVDKTNCEILTVWQEIWKQREIDFSKEKILYTSSNEDLTLTIINDSPYIISIIESPVYVENGDEVGKLIFHLQYPQYKFQNLKTISYEIMNTLEMNNQYKSQPLGLDFSVWFQSDNYISDVGHMYCCQPDEEEINIYLLKNNNIEEINISMENFETGGGVISSDGKYTAFLYWDKADTTGGYGNTFQKGIAYVNNSNPKEVFILKNNGNYRHTQLEWSPNDRYLSYLGRNGNSGIIDMNTGQDIKKLNKSVLVTWIDDDKFSFIDNDKLYLYSISKKQKTFITDYVLQAIAQFESSPVYQKPHWSSDSKYVVYYEGGRNNEASRGTMAGIGKSKEEAVLFDIENEEKHYFGDLLKEGETLFLQRSDINTEFIGWDKKDRFLYFSNFARVMISDQQGKRVPLLKSIKLVNGKKVIEDYNISHIDFEESLRFSSINDNSSLLINNIVYDIESRKNKCVLNIPGRELYHQRFVHKNYLFVVSDDEYSSKNLNYNWIVRENPSAVTVADIYNTTTCEHIGSVVIPNKIQNITIIPN